MDLISALIQIEKYHFHYQLPIQMIEFEDGSQTKFNYRLKGEQKNRFIDLSKPEKQNLEWIKQWEVAAKIMEKF
jgi:hypothetical protein